MEIHLEVTTHDMQISQYNHLLVPAAWPASFSCERSGFEGLSRWRRKLEGGVSARQGDPLASLIVLGYKSNELEVCIVLG